MGSEMCIRDSSSSSDEKKKAIDLTKEVFGVEEVVEYITIKSE